MYKFYQEGSSENEKNEDPEGVKKEQDAYNATKALLPGLFSGIKNVLYTPKQDYSLGVDNKINKLNVDNKNEKVSFVKENRVVPNLMNAKSEDVGTFVNMRPYAKDAGDAHETRPYIDTNQRVFNDLNDADMVVDLLNNKIGRGIGNRNRFTGLKNLALNVLEEFKNNGLYVAEDINGRYIITRRQLGQEKYDKLRKLFENMDNWGFQPGDDRTRDNYAPIRFIWEKIKEKMQ